MSSDRKRFICDQLIRSFATEDSETSVQPDVLSDSSEAHCPVSRTLGDSSENVLSAVMTSSLRTQQKSVTLATSRNARGVGCRSRRLRKARKAKSKRWSNVKYVRAAVHLPPADTSMQPDLEHVDGVLFVSFGVKVRYIT